MADIDELKATFEAWVQAFNSRNLKAFSAGVHNEVIFFEYTAPFPVDGKAAFQQAVQTLVENSESSDVTLINPQYRVIGNTGIAWGLLAFASKPKDGPFRTVFGRYTVTLTKADGKWLVVADHLSALPDGGA